MILRLIFFPNESGASRRTFVAHEPDQLQKRFLLPLFEIYHLQMAHTLLQQFNMFVKRRVLMLFAGTHICDLSLQQMAIVSTTGRVWM